MLKEEVMLAFLNVPCPLSPQGTNDFSIFLHNVCVFRHPLWLSDYIASMKMNKTTLENEACLWI